MKKVMMLVMIIQVLLFVNIVYGGEDIIYEKDGCIYIIGNLTKEERAANKELFRKRAEDLSKRMTRLDERKHEIKVKKLELDTAKENKKANEFYFKSLVREGVGSTTINLSVRGGHSKSNLVNKTRRRRMKNTR